MEKNKDVKNATGDRIQWPLVEQATATLGGLPTGQRNSLLPEGSTAITNIAILKN